VAPGSPLERRIAEIWQQCLGVDRIGMLDSFFALGGDSLLAVQTIDRLRRDLGREIPVTNVYEGVTVRDLARLLEPSAAAEPDDGNRQERMLSRRSLQREMRLRRRQEDVR
jgi:acyl carrier protein